MRAPGTLGQRTMKRGPLVASVLAIGLAVASSSAGTDQVTPGSSARRTQQDVPRADPSIDDMFVTPWVLPALRVRLPLSHLVTRHDGERVNLLGLVGKPMAVSFAYTRCANPNKCRKVTRTMGELREKLTAAGILGRVRLLLITYDAEWDTLSDLTEFARVNNLELDEHAMFLRPDMGAERALYRDLKLKASFNAAGVTMHRIEMLLIDSAGRLARKYHTLIWDNDQVVEDLERLIDEAVDETLSGGVADAGSD